MMIPHQNLIRHSRGFSLVEIMVGLGISLIATLVIMQVFIAFEGQKRTTTSGSDAQTNGGLALYTIERDVRMAGYGFSVPAALGCEIRSSYGGVDQPPLSLAPVAITSGANGLPDTISVLSSSKESWSIPAKITTDHPPQATNFFLNTTLGIAVGDLMLAFEPGKYCTLLQVTGIPNGKVQIHHQSTSPWDPPGGQNIFPPGGYNAGATLFNLGALVRHTYSLDANSNLLFSDFLSATNTTNVQAIISDIVNLQAQYGFDTRVGPQSDGRVDTWSDTMIDANSSGGTPGDAEDIQRVYAVRMAVVARSALLEKPNSDGTCNVTTATSINRPTWAGGAIDVSKNPDGSANGNWQCYRYKVFETVIPLRNPLWGKS